MTDPDPLVRPMSARRPDEAHRAPTPLELFFDLVFVVAIATAASDLHHGVAENHAVEAVTGYSLVFFGIWWAWVNFTWFASAYDTDDVPYRLLVFVQMTGALIFASGVSVLAEGIWSWLSVVTWSCALRWSDSGSEAAAHDSERRKTALRYANSESITCSIQIEQCLPPAQAIHEFALR